MTESPFDLSGKVALVTGANTGLGQGMAIALAQAGADIVLIGRSEPVDTLEQLSGLGVETHSILTDLGNIDNVESIISEAVSTLGRVDILVNNAGIIKRNEAIDFTPDEWDAVMNVNLRTLFFLSQAFARHIVAESKSGKIVNIASMLTLYLLCRTPDEQRRFPYAIIVNNFLRLQILYTIFQIFNKC